MKRLACFVLSAAFILCVWTESGAGSGNGVLVGSADGGEDRVLMFWSAGAATRCYTAKTSDLDDFRLACVGALAAPAYGTRVSRLSPLDGIYLKVRVLDGEYADRVGWVLRRYFMAESP